MAGASILISGIMLLLFKRQYFFTTVGCVAIIIIGLENRGLRFERILSILVILFLIITFMFV